MEVNEKITVKYIGEDDPLSLRKDKLYTARILIRNWYGIVDETGEEYAYPPELFETTE
jgi:hypothetical protein